MLVFLIGCLPLPSQNMLVSIPSLSIQKNERIIGFEIRVRSGRIAQIPNVPIGWNVFVDNDPSWNTVVKGSIAVGAAAMDADFLRHFIIVEAEEGAPSDMPFALQGKVVVTSDFSSERTIPLIMKDFLAEPQSEGLQGSSHEPATPEPCRMAPTELGRDAIHILRVEALSNQPTDGTYADEGYGQGEFDTVKLLEVLKSPIRWESGHVFRVHPFPGKRSRQDNFAPEHLTISKSYFLVYTYSLDDEPSGESDLIGLTRCGVLEDMPAVRAQLLEGVTHSTRHRSTAKK
jgi:hypothetical protein